MEQIDRSRTINLPALQNIYQPFSCCMRDVAAARRLESLLSLWLLTLGGPNSWECKDQGRIAYAIYYVQRLRCPNQNCWCSLSFGIFESVGDTNDRASLSVFWRFIDTLKLWSFRVTVTQYAHFQNLWSWFNMQCFDLPHPSVTTSAARHARTAILFQSMGVVQHIAELEVLLQNSTRLASEKTSRVWPRRATNSAM